MTVYSTLGNPPSNVYIDPVLILILGFSNVERNDCNHDWNEERKKCLLDDYNHEAKHGVDLCEYGGHDISYIIVLTWSQFMPTV